MYTGCIVEKEEIETSRGDNQICSKPSVDNAAAFAACTKRISRETRRAERMRRTDRKDQEQICKGSRSAGVVVETKTNVCEKGDQTPHVDHTIEHDTHTTSTRALKNRTLGNQTIWCHLRMWNPRPR